MNVLEQARYGINSYQEWLKAEGLRVVEGLAIDCTEVETAEWPRVGTRAAALHLDGRGDFCNMLLYELGPGQSTLPQRHLFEEVVYVVDKGLLRQHIRSRSISSSGCSMRSGLRRSRMHAARRAASPSFFSTPRSTSTPASDDSCPPSNPTLNFCIQPMEDRREEEYLRS